MKYNVLIADDEKTMRLGVSSILEKCFQNKVRCIQVENGKKALDYIHNEEIHIAIVDINMPFMSGIDFIMQVKKEKKEIPIIIISGYQDFAYAQQAIKYGVVDYITKPFQKEVLIDTIQSILDKENQRRHIENQVDMRSPIMEEKYINSLLIQLVNGKVSDTLIKELENKKIFRDSLFKKMISIHYCINQNSLDEIQQVTKITCEIEQVFNKLFEKEQGITYSMLPYRTGCLGLLLESDSQNSIHHILQVIKKHKTWIDSVISCKYCIGIGNTVNFTSELSRSFEQSLNASDYKLFEHDNNIYEYKKDTVDLVEYYPFSFTEVELNKTFQKILAMQKIQLKLVLLRWFYTLLSNKEQNYQITNSINKEFHFFWDFYQLKKEIEIKIPKVAVDGTSMNTSDLIDGITQYILHNLREELDINIIARKYKKSPGYLGMIFKKRYNISMSEFITRERIELAKKLLRKSDMNVGEVSSYCGYNSSKYFAVSFKKIEGVSPSRYIQLYRNGKNND